MIKQQYVVPALREFVLENLAMRQCHPILRASYQPDLLIEADRMFADHAKATKLV